MVDVYRANRQFERFLDLGDSNEPPDDRKTLRDMSRYPRRTQGPAVDIEKSILIAVMHYFLDEQREEVEDMRGKDVNANGSKND